MASDLASYTPAANVSPSLAGIVTSGATEAKSFLESNYDFYDVNKHGKTRYNLGVAYIHAKLSKHGGTIKTNLESAKTDSVTKVTSSHTQNKNLPSDVFSGIESTFYHAELDIINKINRIIQDGDVAPINTLREFNNNLAQEDASVIGRLTNKLNTADGNVTTLQGDRVTDLTNSAIPNVYKTDNNLTTSLNAELARFTAIVGNISELDSTNAPVAIGDSTSNLTAATEQMIKRFDNVVQKLLLLHEELYLDSPDTTVQNTITDSFDYGLSDGAANTHFWEYAANDLLLP